jgi:hypothetical protein
VLHLRVTIVVVLIKNNNECLGYISIKNQCIALFI